mgnify:CR=1 FL=1
MVESVIDTETEKNILHEIISKHDYIHEFRIQRIVYLSDIIWYLKNNQRMTTFDYKFFKKGVFSSEMRNLLEELDERDIKTFSDFRVGNETYIYVERDDISCIENETVRETIELAIGVTKEVSASELDSWSKETVPDLYPRSLIIFENLDKDRVTNVTLDYFPELSNFIT